MRMGEAKMAPLPARGLDYSSKNAVATASHLRYSPCSTISTHHAAPCRFLLRSRARAEHFAVPMRDTLPLRRAGSSSGEVAPCVHLTSTSKTLCLLLPKRPLHSDEGGGHTSRSERVMLVTAGTANLFTLQERARSIPTRASSAPTDTSVA